MVRIFILNSLPNRDLNYDSSQLSCSTGICRCFAIAAWAEAPLKVVATTGMIADAARQVGGDQVEVKGLMGPGVDPHAYRQTRSDIVAMTRADLILWHGLYLEAQMEDFFHDLGRKRTVVAVAEGVDKSKLRAHDDYADKYDPHVWMSPALWRDVVVEVQEALTDARPDAADFFSANAQAHLAEIDQLETYAKPSASFRSRKQPRAGHGA